MPQWDKPCSASNTATAQQRNFTFWPGLISFSNTALSDNHFSSTTYLVLRRPSFVLANGSTYSQVESFTILKPFIADIYLGFLGIINTLMFLRQGLYPNLSLKILNIQQQSTTNVPRSVGYSFMSR